MKDAGLVVLRVLYAAGVVVVVLAWSGYAVLGTVDAGTAGQVVGSVETAAANAVSGRWWSREERHALGFAGLADSDRSYD